MELKNYKITEIKPAAYNPRTITEKELSGLKESIKKFGFVDPLIINTRTGVLVGGHQRLKAAELLGFKEVPCVEVDLSQAEEMALNVALNSHTIQGKFDLEILPTVLEEIKIEIPDLPGLLNFDQLISDLKIGFDPNFEEPKEKEIDENLKTENTCPSCGYVW
jgi:ParB-like chromosome segregation protein Spo0J